MEQKRLGSGGATKKIHEIPRSLAIGFLLEHDVQIRGRSERVQEGPEREPLTAVPGQAEVDFHMLDAGVESIRRDCG